MNELSATSKKMSIKKISFKQLVWLFFVVFFIHNIEEFLSFPSWLEENISAIPLFLSSKIALVFHYNFIFFIAIALSLATLLPLFICIWANKTKNKQITIFLLLTIAWVMMLNAFQHIFNTLIMNEYTPGLITALLINLPFSIYFILRLKKEKAISKMKLFLYLPIGLVAYFLSVAAISLISYNILNFIKP